MRNFRKRLALMTELPEASFGACPYIAIESNGAVTVDACLDILSYDECEVRLQLEGLVASVRGRELTMRSYGNKTIRITGIIEGISLVEEKRRGSHCS